MTEDELKVEQLRYVAEWKAILNGLLHWSDDAIESWICARSRLFDDPFALFLHEVPAYYVAHEFITQRIRDDLPASKVGILIREIMHVVNSELRRVGARDQQFWSSLRQRVDDITSPDGWAKYL